MKILDENWDIKTIYDSVVTVPDCFVVNKAGIPVLTYHRLFRVETKNNLCNMFEVFLVYGFLSPEALPIT